MRNLDPTDPPAIGGYPLLARLGAGGMGQVFLSRTPSGRPLALKTVRPEFGADPAFEERFAREIASSDQVRSPWAVAVVDYSPAGQRPQWLATEYAAAPALADWVEQHGPLPESAVRALAAELAEGLRAVHRAGLAHRDVKPSNVLLARRHPLLIDFGIARAADATRHTRTGGVIGTPGYMAPEQVTGGSTAAEPGDVFALGAVLVYAATGRGPFLRRDEEPSAAQLMYRIVHEEPVMDGVPPALVPLVAACLHKSPQDRPTAEALLEELGSGAWAPDLLPGLDAELASGEAELRERLTARPTASAPPAPTAPALLGPAAPTPSAPAAAMPLTPSAAPPVAGFGPPPGAYPVAPVPGAARWESRVRAGLVAAGAVTAVAVVAALAWPDGGSGGGAPGGTGGRTTGGQRSSPSADVLPAAWIGTWKGIGPGSTSADGVVTSRTTQVTVVLTLHAAARGELAGRQISHITEAGSGRDLGCTETLTLRETHGTSMVFEAATSEPTDASAGVLCRRGNVYTLVKTGETLTLADEGSQAAGSPTHLTRSSR
ncbi:serine/threonine-protein kinase [Streptomyces sp. NPDC086787]|uniref:serine/threonine-protein kinase n=1 Tax=Streptomyces sp. NPDC086787 TaxID=3365759 RepID=UPI003815686D